MRRPRATSAFASAFAVLAATAIAGSTPVAGAAEPEGPGKNLSVPLIFAEGVGLTGVPLPADTSTATIETTGIRGAAYPTVKLLAPATNPADPTDLTPYYPQNTVNEWQAQWADGSAQVDPVATQADWGDNLVRQTWNGESKVRVEVGLTLNDPLATPMVGYEMKSLSGSQSSEVWGAVGVVGSDPAALVTKDVTNPAVYSPMAELTIEKIDTQGGTALGTGPIFAGKVSDGTEGAGFAAEVNGSGNVIYGYNWDVTTLDLTSIGLPSRPKSGWYRLTFSLEPAVTIGENEITRHSSIASLNPVDLTQETTEGEEGGGGPPAGTGGGGGTGDHSGDELLAVAAVDEGSGGSGGVTAPYYKPVLASDGFSTSLDINIVSARQTTTDAVAPAALASTPQYAKTTTIPVSITATDNASLLYVDLYAKVPSDEAFVYVHRFLPAGEQTTLTGTFDYAAQGDGRYEFSTRAADYAGNLEPLPLAVEAATTLDTVAPTSSVTAPATATSQYVEVSYTAADTAAGSGFKQAELFVRRPGTTVYDRFTTVYEPSGIVIVKADAGNGAYEFYSRASDVAGNVEAAPATPDAVTVLSLGGGYVPPPSGGGVPVDTAALPTPSPSPSAGTPGGPASPGPSPAPVCAAITVSAPQMITAGEPALVVLRGPAGTKVQLLAYSQPSTTYRTVRTGTLDASGMATFVVWPQTNTRMFARQAQCSNGVSKVLLVQPRLSMTAERLRLRTYTFAGSARAVVPGTIVSVYRYAADGRLILTAQTRLTEARTWQLTRTFLGTGSFRFVARTGGGMVNAPGASPVQLLTIR